MRRWRSVGCAGGSEAHDGGGGNGSGGGSSGNGGCEVSADAVDVCGWPWWWQYL